jgi:hypothetical protein
LRSELNILDSHNLAWTLVHIWVLLD